MGPAALGAELPAGGSVEVGFDISPPRTFVNFGDIDLDTMVSVA